MGKGWDSSSSSEGREKVGSSERSSEKDSTGEVPYARLGTISGSGAWSAKDPVLENFLRGGVGMLSSITGPSSMLMGDVA